MAKSDTRIIEQYPDVMQVAPDSHCVIFENETVRVMEMMLKPGAKIEMHTHPTLMAYSFGDAENKWILPDGSTQNVTIRKGQITWHEAFAHAVKNTGKMLTHLLVIEFKKM